MRNKFILLMFGMILLFSSMSFALTNITDTQITITPSANTGSVNDLRGVVIQIYNLSTNVNVKNIYFTKEALWTGTKYYIYNNVTGDLLCNGTYSSNNGMCFNINLQNGTYLKFVSDNSGSSYNQRFTNTALPKYKKYVILHTSIYDNGTDHGSIEFTNLVNLTLEIDYLLINNFSYNQSIINQNQNLDVNVNVSGAEYYYVDWYVNGNLTLENATTLNYSYFNLSDVVIASLNAINLTSSNATQNITKTIGQTINFTAKNYTGGQISNFTINYNGDSQTAVGTSLIVYNWNKTTQYGFFHPDYANASVNLTTNVSSQSYNFTVFTTNSINFTFRDEETKSLITPTSVRFELIGDYFAENYSTTTGYSYVDLITPDAYTIRYEATGYQQRLYFFQLVNQTTSLLTLYLLNSSSIENQVTINVIDQSSNALEGYFAKILKYDITTNSYQTVEILQTNFEGECVANIVLNTEFYQIIIENADNEVVKITTPTYITKTSLTIPVQLGELVAVNFYNEQDVTDDLTFNSATNNFRYTYTDANNVLSQACLFVYRELYTGDLLVDSSCVQSSSGTILIPVTEVNGTTYRADAYIYWDSTESFRGSKDKTFAQENSFGAFGLLVVIILIITFSFVGIWSPVVALVIMPIPLFLGKFTGLIEINFSVIMSIQVIFIILAYVVGNRG